VVHKTGVLCGGFDIDEVLFVAFLCVGTRFLYELLFASCAYVVHGVTGIATNNRVAGGWKIVSTGGLGFALPVLLSLQSIFGVGVGGGAGVGTAFVRYISYSYLEKSGWSLIPTCFDGLSSLRVYSSSGDLGSPANLEAADPMSPSDVMATGHLLQAERSTIPVHIDNFDVLLLMATEKYEVSSSG